MAVKIALLGLLVLLTSCTGWEAIIAERGADIADEELIVSAWATCMMTPRGAIERTFNTETKKKILGDYCGIFYGQAVE